MPKKRDVSYRLTVLGKPEDVSPLSMRMYEDPVSILREYDRLQAKASSSTIEIYSIVNVNQKRISPEELAVLAYHKKTCRRVR